MSEIPPNSSRRSTKTAAKLEILVYWRRPPPQSSVSKRKTKPKMAGNPSASASWCCGKLRRKVCATLDVRNQKSWRLSQQQRICIYHDPKKNPVRHQVALNRILFSSRYVGNYDLRRRESANPAIPRPSTTNEPGSGIAVPGTDETT